MAEPDPEKPEMTATEQEAAPRPTGWMYKELSIGRWSCWYASPPFQLGLVAFVCFLCPGMFNALSGMGGGGRAANHLRLADKMVNAFTYIALFGVCADPFQNTALYSTFAVVGFFAGSVVNRLGVRWSMSFGGIGYGIYATSLLVSVHTPVLGFNVFAGAFLGVCAGLLWAAQGTIMMSYPPEQNKGRYFSWFWSIFNVGACIGSLV